jgi:glucose-6-phosphate isomerase
MGITIDFSRMLPAFPREAVASYGARVRALHARLAERRAAGGLPFYDLPTQDTSGLKACARRLEGRFANLVVLGIGGSALGLIALNSALRTPYRWAEKAPRLYVLDNIDPERVRTLLDALDPRETLVNVITKSGDTAETMASFLIFREWLRAGAGEAGYRERMLVTTDRAKGALRRIADQDRLLNFAVPDGVGGRFSVLTPVGLLPAALIGIDVDGLLAGAAAMAARTGSPELLENPAYLGAVLHYLGWLGGRHISVMLAYSDRLYDLADWYRQLWAESLGKRADLEGAEVRVGPTPVRSLGVTDQHSQLQLYKEGPDDKIYTLLGVQRFPVEVPIPRAFPELEAVAYLGGRGLGELFQAEARATEAALVKEGRPLTSVIFPAVDAVAVGEFFFWLEVQTVAAGDLLGINPMDQPGVEEGKQFAYGLLGRPGYESRRAAVEAIRSAAGAGGLSFS